MRFVVTTFVQETILKIPSQKNLQDLHQHHNSSISAEKAEPQTNLDIVEIKYYSNYYYYI
jgi:hypothetical protein